MASDIFLKIPPCFLPDPGLFMVKKRADGVGMAGRFHFVECVDHLTAYIRILKQGDNGICEVGIADFSQQKYKTLPSSACIGIPADLQYGVDLIIRQVFS